MKWDWAKLRAAMVERFPLVLQEDAQQNALTEMLTMKQNDLPLNNYFDKARRIRRHIDKGNEKLFL